MRYESFVLSVARGGDFAFLKDPSSRNRIFLHRDDVSEGWEHVRVGTNIEYCLDTENDPRGPRAKEARLILYGVRQPDTK